MFIKSIALVVSTLVLSTSVHAAVVNPILGLNIGGTLYNVTFHDSAGASFNALWDADDDGVFGGGTSLFSTAPAFWGDKTGAQGAALAISAALGTSDASTASSDSFIVPYDAVPWIASITPGLEHILGYFDVFTEFDRDYIAYDFFADNYYRYYAPYASFTVVPVPAAVWLFGSGLLGLFGVAKRKVRT